MKHYKTTVTEHHYGAGPPNGYLSWTSALILGAVCIGLTAYAAGSYTEKLRVENERLRVENASLLENLVESKRTADECYGFLDACTQCNEDLIEKVYAYEDSLVAAQQLNTYYKHALSECEGRNADLGRAVEERDALIETQRVALSTQAVQLRLAENRIQQLIQPVGLLERLVGPPPSRPAASARLAKHSSAVSRSSTEKAGRLPSFRFFLNFSLMACLVLVIYLGCLRLFRRRLFRSRIRSRSAGS